MRTYQLRLWRAGDEDVVAAGNEVGGAINVGVAAGGNAITDETSVVLYAELVEEVKGLTDELNGWVTDDDKARVNGLHGLVPYYSRLDGSCTSNLEVFSIPPVKVVTLVHDDVTPILGVV
ncbi:hypothetical protein V6N13_079507 [Hibiscus sabdariffa]